jgi:hypothetical protein
MSHHAATLQYTFEKTASALDLAYTAIDRLYWLDDNYVQPNPFYSWAAPRRRGYQWHLLGTRHSH